MYCPNCGVQNASNSRFCSGCGNSLAESPSGAGTFQSESTWSTGGRPHVPNYLVQAILVTILCCLIPGIVAIVYAAQVNGKLAAGDVAGAQQASNNAKTWSWVAFGLGLGVGLIYIVFFILLGSVGG